MTSDIPQPKDETRLISLLQLQNGTNQDQALLTQLGRLEEKTVARRSSWRTLIFLYVVVALVGLLGGIFSAFISIVSLAVILPKVVRAMATENVEPTRLTYSLETSDSNFENVATRFKQVSEACQNLARADAFFLRQLHAKATIRLAKEIQINDLELKPWCIGNDSSMLYFFPEYLVVREGANHALLPYKLLRVTLQAHSQVLTTNNPALITFIAPQGPFFELLVSDPYLAESFCDAINS